MAKADAGNYDKPMRLQEATETNTQGTVTAVWANVAEMWCSLTPLAGREYFLAQSVNSEVTHVVRTWWRADVTPTSKMRLTYDSRTFEILSVVDVDERHIEFEFRVKE